MHNIAVADTAIFSPRLVNVLTLGVNYFYQSFNDAETGVDPLALGLNTGVTQSVLQGSPKITITGFDYVGATSPEARTDTTGHITNFVPGRGFVTPGSDIDSLYPKDFNNFAPRFGFAYKPTVDGKTVIRGGWGIYYDVPALNFFVANTGSPNGGAAGIHANPGGANPVYTINAKNVVIQDGVPVFGSAGPVPPYGAFGVSQDFRTPYVHNFNLNIQRQLSSSTILQAGYVGSLGRKLAIMQDINQPIGGVRPFAQSFPQLAAIDMINSISNSAYNLPAGAAAADVLEGPERDLQLHLGARHRRHLGCPQHHPHQ